MLLHDLGLFFLVYSVLLLLQLVALPIIFYVSERFPYLKDAAWGFGRIATILVLSLLVWHLAFWQLPVNTSLGVGALFLILLLLSVYFLWKFFWSKKNFFTKFWTKFGRVILLEEAIFFLAMLFIFAMRSFQPEILGLEKFMDAGFIQAYLKSPTLPAADMWYAGESINYYSFGHFYNAILVQLWQMDLTYAYNYLLMVIFSLFCVELFALAFNLRANFGKENFKANVGAGLLAILLVALGSNGHALWYFLSQGSFANYWYPDATRFIERTIHEFPSYSFVVSDLHAHVLALPINLLLMQTIFMWFQEIIAFSKISDNKKILRRSFFYLALLMGVLFGVLVMTNTWDVLIYGLLLTLIAVLLLLKKGRLFLSLLSSAGAVFLTTALFSLLWFLNFEPISSGLAVANERSPLWQLAVMWGPHLLMAIFCLWLTRSIWLPTGKKLSSSVILVALLTSVLFLLTFPEIFYFKDIYTTYPRANTMFKLVFQAFMLLGILLSVLLSLVLFATDRELSLFKWRFTQLSQVLPGQEKISFAAKVRLRKLVLLYLPLTAFLFFSSVAYPYLAYRNYYGAWKNYQGLDGLAWLNRKHPADLAIINYLKANESQQVNILEAVGESYTEFARVSAFSGMPTILGWRVHEWLWRAGWDGPARRTAEVEKIYTNPTHPESGYYLQIYGIKYIVISGKEKEAYLNLDLAGLLSLGEVVVQVKDNYLLKLN